MSTFLEPVPASMLRCDECFVLCSVRSWGERLRSSWVMAVGFDIAVCALLPGAFELCGID